MNLVANEPTDEWIRTKITIRSIANHIMQYHRQSLQSLCRLQILRDNRWRISTMLSIRVCLVHTNDIPFPLKRRANALHFVTKWLLRKLCLSVKNYPCDAGGNRYTICTERKGFKTQKTAIKIREKERESYRTISWFAIFCIKWLHICSSAGMHPLVCNQMCIENQMSIQY